jgi:hypothetical protein
MDLRKRREHSVEKLPLGTIRTRQQKRADGSRFKVRVIKLSNRGRGDQKWRSYARWLWAQHHGPVPAGKRVLHKDGDTMNDRLANLILGTASDALYLHCHMDAERSAAQLRRAHAGCAQRNREVGFLRRSTEILPSLWYPVDVDRRFIVNDPRRSRRMIYAGAAINGRGFLGWCLGWPELPGLEAAILAILSDGAFRKTRQLCIDLAAVLLRYGLGTPQVPAIRSACCVLRRRGMLAGMRGAYRIVEACLAARGDIFPYVAVRGVSLIDGDQYRGFELGATASASPFGEAQ